MIRILDYGMGNLKSVSRALEAVGAAYDVASDLKGAQKLLIPGVGAFGAAMQNLGPLKQEIRAFAAGGGPVFGICLGMQLLFTCGEENPSGPPIHVEGLDLIPGRVTYLRPREGFKVPHIGWNSATFTPCDLVPSGGSAYYYFVHSLAPTCEDPSHSVATTEHGDVFTSAVQRDHVWGTQFHPEKSGPAGLAMLEAFSRC